MLAKILFVACLIGLAVGSEISYQDCIAAIYSGAAFGNSESQISSEIQNYLGSRGYKDIAAALAEGLTIDSICLGLYAANIAFDALNEKHDDG